MSEGWVHFLAVPLSLPACWTGMWLSVFLHEMAHYAALRWYGVSPLEVNVGTGRVILAFDHRLTPMTTTRWTLRLWAGNSSVVTRANDYLTHLQRVWVYAAGPLVNVLIGAAATVAFFLHSGSQTGLGGQMLSILLANLSIYNSWIILSNLASKDPDTDGQRIQLYLGKHRLVKARRRAQAKGNAEQP